MISRGQASGFGRNQAPKTDRLNQSPCLRVTDRRLQEAYGLDVDWMNGPLRPVQLFEPPRGYHVLHCLLIWHVLRTMVFLVTSPTQSPKNSCLSYRKRRHTSSNSSSRLCMIISDEEMLHTEARKCCDYALMRNSTIWCLAAQ